MIFQIVPRLYPSVDGLGDYALTLALRLKELYQLDTHFIVCDPLWEGGESLQGFKVSRLENRNKCTLFELLKKQNARTVLLHYVGYGYQNKGLPFWIVSNLKKWKKGDSNKFVVMFHETYVISHNPFGTLFWVSYLQKLIARDLLVITDKVVTNKEQYALELNNLSPKSIEIPVIPVFSNIGEIKVLSELGKRKKRLVVFGGKGYRSKVYQFSEKFIKIAIEKLGIEEIVDIGPSVENCPENICGVPVISKGILESVEISQILSESLAGILNYDPYYLGRSGIFAAYAAHGVVPINSQFTDKKVDGLKAQVHYWAPNPTDKLDFQEIALNANSWYIGHNVDRHAALFYEQLR
mgnify:CR=1 FL=1